MTKYYMLECFRPREWDESAGLKAAPDVVAGASWTIGRPFAEPPREPLAFELRENLTDRMVALYHTDAIVMTKRVLAAFEEAGVDNLDVYQAVIRHRRTGFVTHDYVAANLVGLVSAADLALSKVVGGSRDGRLDVDFDSVVIDEQKSSDLLMFRLAESTNAIVVHERVARIVRAAGVDTLTFMPPERWMG